jgi:hypothetical protein
MIVIKSRYIRTQIVGGGVIFSTVANIIKKITGNTVGALASKLMVLAGKSTASEVGKRLATRFIAPPSSVLALQAAQPTVHPVMAQPFTQPVMVPIQPIQSPAPLVTSANPQTKLNEIMTKYSPG